MKRLRFTNDEDLTLLREVVAQNPFEDLARWNTIAQQVEIGTKKNFSVRAVREHTARLLKSWEREDRENRNR